MSKLIHLSVLLALSLAADRATAASPYAPNPKAVTNTASAVLEREDQRSFFYVTRRGPIRVGPGIDFHFGHESGSVLSPK